MSTRLAAGLAAAALLCGCAGPKASTAGASASAAATSAAAVSGPANAPVAQAGRSGGIPLDPAQRAELDRTVAKAPPGERSRLRYALATGDDGKRRLVVYDGEGLGAGARPRGKAREYIVFKVLNGPAGEHYDPQQNSIVAPIPPPVQRDNAVTPPR